CPGSAVRFVTIRRERAQEYLAWHHGAIVMLVVGPLLVRLLPARTEPGMLQLANLDDRTRRYMILEFEYDSSHNQVYISPRLSPRGRADWPGLLRESFLSGNDAILASQLRLAGRLGTREARQTKRGRVIGVNVPETAAETLAE